MSAQRIARCGLSCALLAASAWVSIPLGPVPFTLQTLVLAMLPGVLAPREAVLTVATYLVLGGVGLPVFSNMMGGIGVLLGPTGGFLWGFLIGMVAATAIARIERLPQTARDVLSRGALLLISYALGTAQLMVVGSLALPAALAVAVLPFAVPDVVKMAVGVIIARAVARALPQGRVHAR